MKTYALTMIMVATSMFACLAVKAQTKLEYVGGQGVTITIKLPNASPAIGSVNAADFSIREDGDGALKVKTLAVAEDKKTIGLTVERPLKLDTAYSVTMQAGASKIAGSFRTWDNDPKGIQVFILAGQSNMVGCGKSEMGSNPNYDKTDPKSRREIPAGIGCLRHLAIHDTDQKSPHYRNLLVDPKDPKNSKWKVRDDAKVWWKDGFLDKNRRVRKGDFGVGFGAGNGHGKWIGPEFGFGHVVSDHIDQPVLIIKTAWGGIGLHDGFRSPSAVAKRGGVVGPYYKAIFEDVREVLDDIGAQFPEWKGKGYRIRGIGWHQGYTDAVSKKMNTQYEMNLADLIHDLRLDFGQPDLPFAISTTSMWPADRPDGVVELAQRALADPKKHPEFKGNVRTTDSGPFWRDRSVSPSGMGYHWNHNGESYFLIGHHMGKDMIEMLKR